MQLPPLPQQAGHLAVLAQEHRTAGGPGCDVL